MGKDKHILLQRLMKKQKQKKSSDSSPRNRTFKAFAYNEKTRMLAPLLAFAFSF